MKIGNIKLFEFGETIPGLQIYGKPAPYPVLNERAVRAGAGIMFLLGIIAFFNALFLKNFVFIQILVIVFTLEFALRIFFTPKIAPISMLANFLVSNQHPDYVGAIQKRFAWSLGFVMAGSMLIVVHLLGLTGLVPFSICLACLAIMWMETSLGICVGCKIYNGLVDAGALKPEVRAACPGNVCAVNPEKGD